MRLYASGLAASLSAARSGSIAPAWFLWVVCRDRETGEDAPLGLWSGDEDITVAVEKPDAGTATRTYHGGCGLAVEGLQYVADLTDHPVTARLSQIAPEAQQVIRGYDARLAYTEIHATTWNGGVLSSVPQLMWVGIVDEGPIGTPAAGDEGQISLVIRSEIMAQLQRINPAKSSDQHQRRRLASDRFCEFASIISARDLQWYKGT